MVPKTTHTNGSRELEGLRQAYERLSAHPEKNLFSLARTLRRIRSRVEEERPKKRSELVTWLETEERRQEDRLAEFRRTFGPRLSRLLEAHGLKVQGHAPRLRVPPFQLEMNVRGGTARLLYGPELLRRGLGLNPKRLADSIQGLREDLERGGLDPGTLRRAVHLAIDEAGTGGRARIVDVLDRIRETSQSQEYGRPQFAFDLHRLLRASPGQGTGIRLIVATFDQTRRKRDHLWVQTKESGEGTRFAYIVREKP
jgi:hypothetical protein